MNENINSQDQSENKEGRPNLKIQSRVPIRTIGIETQRERKNYSDLPPQNYLHVWWARRPTPATRLALLGSVLPDDVDEDTFLDWLGIQPDSNSSEESIAEIVRERKRTEDQRDGALYEHYGYRKSYKNLPNSAEMEQFHSKVKETWGGDLPTVLDGTAGGGSIPFESIRYGLPTVANELNPVASVLLKAVLEHPRTEKDISSDIEEWGEKINSIAREKLDEYYPSSKNEQPTEYLWAHTIDCPDCGLEVPLAPDWWLHKENSNSGVAAKPEISSEKDTVSFNVVNLPEDVEKSEYNPTDGTVSYGKATCPRCNVTIEGDEVKRQAQEEGMGIQQYAAYVKELTKGGDRHFRAPTVEEEEAVTKAQEHIRNDIELSNFLDEERYIGLADRAANYGVTEWRDAFNPRQLLVHYTYWQAYETVKSEIQDEYPKEEAEALLTFLSIAADKAVDYNSKFSSWHHGRSLIRNTFERHDFSFKWSFAESCLTAEGYGYDWVIDSVVEVFEELRELSNHSDAPTKVYQGDAGQLPLDDEEIEVIVLDPPYYDNVMYSELSDFFYVWMKRYLGDVYPEFFSQELAEKQQEAVANPAEFEDIAGEGQSKSSMAKEDYERKMSKIFSESHRVLEDDGIFTLMFTHKKTEAWDTLTKALIEAGFVVTATHPVTTENPTSLHHSGKNSAESTILLASEKRTGDITSQTLWSDIQDRTREVARDRAKELDESEVSFAKVDIILASFGPTLEVFTEEYPVVDDTGDEISPQRALDEARDAVRDYFIDKYLNSGVRDVDHKTEWYVLSWLVFEAQRFPYDEARRLAMGVGEDLDALKKTHRMWRKKSGDVLLRPHGDRVQDVNKDADSRSGRKPVNPDALSFATALDKVHAAMHLYEAKGATETWNWLNDRNCGSDPAFKATLEALLRVLPHNHDDWKLARDLAAGETGDILDLDLDADIFRDEDDGDDEYQGSLNDF